MTRVSSKWADVRATPNREVDPGTSYLISGPSVTRRSVEHALLLTTFRQRNGIQLRPRSSATKRGPGEDPNPRNNELEN